MRKRFIVVIFLVGLLESIQAQSFSLKTNALYWLTTSINAGAEIALNDKSTFNIEAAYNPWTFRDDKKMRFWLVQPEYRRWMCEKFEGHFIGIHAHGAQYFGGFRNKRYDGYLVGGGISYGYDWILSPHWNLEVSLGVGYAYLWYKQSPRIPCVKCQEDRHKHYVGPTKASVSFSYIF